MCVSQCGYIVSLVGSQFILNGRRTSDSGHITDVVPYRLRVGRSYHTGQLGHEVSHVRLGIQRLVHLTTVGHWHTTRVIWHDKHKTLKSTLIQNQFTHTPLHKQNHISIRHHHSNFSGNYIFGKFYKILVVDWRPIWALSPTE